MNEIDERRAEVIAKSLLVNWDRLAPHGRQEFYDAAQAIRESDEANPMTHEYEELCARLWETIQNSNDMAAIDAMKDADAAIEALVRERDGLRNAVDVLGAVPIYNPATEKPMPLEPTEDMVKAGEKARQEGISPLTVEFENGEIHQVTAETIARLLRRCDELAAALREADKLIKWMENTRSWPAPFEIKKRLDANKEALAKLETNDD